MEKYIDVPHTGLLGKILATLNSYPQILGEYSLEQLQEGESVLLVELHQFYQLRF